MGGSESKPNPTPPDPDGYTLTLFSVGMTCEGCAGACKRILGKVDGVESVGEGELRCYFVCLFVCFLSE